VPAPTIHTLLKVRAEFCPAVLLDRSGDVHSVVTDRSHGRPRRRVGMLGSAVGERRAGA